MGGVAGDGVHASQRNGPTLGQWRSLAWRPAWATGPDPAACMVGTWGLVTPK